MPPVPVLQTFGLLQSTMNTLSCGIRCGIWESDGRSEPHIALLNDPNDTERFKKSGVHESAAGPSPQAKESA